MDYVAATKYLDSFAYGRIKLGLTRIEQLLQILGNPHHNQKYIHVAGTNGKGSVCQCIYSILTQAGLKVGIFTSPYLVKINQSYKIDTQISDEDFAQCISKIANALKTHTQLEKDLTWFEVKTAIAFLYFEDKCDCVILETGLGGLYDSTNIIQNPIVSIITKISFDHMDYLGDTVQSIATNKAGIIKEKSTVIVAPQEHSDALQVIKTVAATKDCWLVQVGVDSEIVVHDDLSFDYLGYRGLKSNLIGRHQIDNAATAVHCASALTKFFDIQPDHIAKGLKQVEWHCRLELVCDKPKVYIDAAHNIDGVTSMLDYITSTHKDKKIKFVFGILKDKPYSQIVDMIAPFADIVYTVTPDSVRALSSQDLATAIGSKSVAAISCDSYKLAVDKVFDSASEEDIVVVFGSLYMVGYVRELIIANTKN